jgi:hypothetical protein
VVLTLFVQMEISRWRCGLVSVFVFVFLIIGVQSFSDGRSHLIAPYRSLQVIQKWEMHERFVHRKSARVPSECIDNAFVTFIMPTSSARTTLPRAIKSILNLKDCNWRLILVYSDLYAHADGLQKDVPIPLAILPAAYTSDPRIQYLWSRSGRVSQNYGGNSRNLAFQYVSTPWIAFLDDDDLITRDYVDRLKEEAQSYPSASLILFRMACEFCFSNITPPADLFDIKVNYAGISFAVKPDVVVPRGQIKFTDGPAEDYHFLHDIVSCEKYVVISGAITYLVKGFVAYPNAPIRSVQIPGKNTCREKNYNPPIISKDYLGFKFPEAGSMFFGSNVIGLKQSLFRARLTGCVDDNIFDHLSVEFHFGFETPIKNPNALLVQAQMEQIHNKTVPNAHQSASTVFSLQYIAKMRNASQVKQLFNTRHLKCLLVKRSLMVYFHVNAFT